MKQLVIIDASGLGKVVYEIAKKKYVSLIFLDDNLLLKMLMFYDRKLNATLEKLYGVEN